MQHGKTQTIEKRTPQALRVITVLNPSESHLYLRSENRWAFLSFPLIFITYY